MNYTMTDILAVAKGIEATRALGGEREFAIKRRFDPRSMSHENWVGIVYPEMKLFLDGLTVENFKQILDDHRVLRNEREDKNAYLKKIRPDLFTFIETGRIYPLQESRYKKCRDKIKKRTKLSSPVLFFDECYAIIETEKAQEIIKERKENEKKEVEFSTINS